MTPGKLADGTLAYGNVAGDENGLVASTTEQALLRNSENLEARIYLAAVHSLAGQRDAAAWQVSEIRALEPAFTVRSWLATYPMTHAKQTDQLLKSLQGIGL